MEKKWQVTMIKLQNGEVLYKVTRRYPEHEVAETKIFKSREEAKQQLEEWLE